MTTKLYLASSALTGRATITDIVRGAQTAIRLSHTHFHPQGGGQRADVGHIDGCRVLDVRHTADGDVDHLVDDAGRLVRGSEVEIDVDPGRRRLHARLHTAGHLVADAALALSPELLPKSGHHWPGETRVELLGVLPCADEFASFLQEKIDGLVKMEIPVSIVGDPYRDRKVQIGDFKSVPCGGTHISNTNQLKGLLVRKVQSKKGIVRIGYELAR